MDSQDQQTLTEHPRMAGDAFHAGAMPTPIPSGELLQGQPYIHIEHGGGLYTLRATRSGKLILTK